MKTIVAERVIDAPLPFVFRTVSEIENFAQAVPKIVAVEFLSDIRTGAGTRFRETRKMGKREVSTTLEVTEYVPNDRIRLVADEMGTIWDSTFDVHDSGGRTLLRLTMEGRTQRWTTKVFLGLIRGMVVKALEEDMDSVKSYCEARHDAAATSPNSTD